MRQILLLALMLLCSWAALAEPLKCPAPVTRMEVEKGQYSPMEGAVFGLEGFSATMVARGKSSPLCFARTTDVQHGEVFIGSESLSRLFAQKVQQTESSVTDVKVEVQENSAHLSGKVHKGIALPFDIEGPVSTDGTVLELKAKKIKMTGIPVKALLGMLGKHLGSLMGSESANGVVAKGDTLIFEPSKIAHVRGRITKAQLTSKGLMLTFGSEPPKKPKQQAKLPSSTSSNAGTAGSSSPPGSAPPTAPRRSPFSCPAVAFPPCSSSTSWAKDSLQPPTSAIRNPRSH